MATAAIVADGRLEPAVLGLPGPRDRVTAVLRSALGHDAPTIVNLSVRRC